MAEQRLGALQTLTAGLAHQIRNPLNSARLQLEVAERRLRRSGGDPTLAEPIELAHREIDRLAHLVDELLVFARPLALDAREHDVVAIARDVLEREQPAALRARAHLSLVGDPAVLAEVDPVKLGQVIENLVVNAIEAVPHGGHVSVAVVGRGKHVHICVTDDGGGIPSDVLPRVYEPFFSTKADGTGMGMSIVHSLVALHRGAIEVRSSAVGTTFDVSIPRRA